MAARKYGEGKTPHRTIRSEREEWLPFGANCERVGSDRTTVLREFMKWFNREPGAKIPERPARLTAEELAEILADEAR